MAKLFHSGPRPSLTPRKTGREDEGSCAGIRASKASAAQSKPRGKGRGKQGNKKMRKSEGRGFGLSWVGLRRGFARVQSLMQKPEKLKVNQKRSLFFTLALAKSPSGPCQKEVREKRKTDRRPDETDFTILMGRPSLGALELSQTLRPLLLLDFGSTSDSASAAASTTAGATGTGTFVGTSAGAGASSTKTPSTSASGSKTATSSSAFVTSSNAARSKSNFVDFRFMQAVVVLAASAMGKGDFLLAPLGLMRRDKVDAIYKTTEERLTYDSEVIQCGAHYQISCGDVHLCHDA
ncbi:hypothetical protein C8J56DRAFT_894929 [Mycena floridula]|nr:hypothetical protein C8J56DRAFT_894929 [Mycena floridula]